MLLKTDKDKDKFNENPQRSTYKEQLRYRLLIQMDGDAATQMCHKLRCRMNIWQQPQTLLDTSS